MNATVEETALLEKWKRKLCLQEWRIRLYTHCRPEEMSMRNATGCTEWSEPIKTARIEIINPAHYGDRVMHQIIDDLARAFTEVDNDE